MKKRTPWTQEKRVRFTEQQKAVVGKYPPEIQRELMRNWNKFIEKIPSAAKRGEEPK